MTRLRRILTFLLLIPIVMLIDAIFIRPIDAVGDPRELTFLLIGLPILVINYWAWYAPHVLETIINDRSE